MKPKEKRDRQRRYEMLTSALSSGGLLEYRTFSEPDVREYGYVFGLTDRFVLLQIASKDVFLDGYAVYPLREISSARLGTETFLVRALLLYGFLPAAPKGILLDDWQALLASADAHFPLVTIHPELKHPGTCYVGRVSEFKKRTVILRKIDADAEWVGEREAFRFKDITQVSFGARYEAALWRVSQSELSNSGNP